jgi:hypothetical protein
VHRLVAGTGISPDRVPWCSQPDPTGDSPITTAKPLARYGAIWRPRSRAASLPPSYTTIRDTTPPRAGCAAACAGSWGTQAPRPAGGSVAPACGPYPRGFAGIRYISLGYAALPGECWIPVPLPPPYLIVTIVVFVDNRQKSPPQLTPRLRLRGALCGVRAARGGPHARRQSHRTSERAMGWRSSVYGRGGEGQ